MDGSFFGGVFFVFCYVVKFYVDLYVCVVVELNVGVVVGYVGCDGYCFWKVSLGDDEGFLFVVVCV